MTLDKLTALAEAIEQVLDVDPRTSNTALNAVLAQASLVILADEFEISQQVLHEFIPAKAHFELKAKYRNNEFLSQSIFPLIRKKIGVQLHEG